MNNRIKINIHTVIGEVLLYLDNILEDSEIAIAVFIKHSIFITFVVLLKILQGEIHDNGVQLGRVNIWRVGVAEDVVLIL